MKEKILVFIPMYNCEKQIVRVAEQLAGDISSYISEAIFVNNRSTDNGEAALIEKLKTLALPFPVKVLRNKENYGLGGSHKVAFNYAIEHNFDYIIVLHGDDQGCISDFLPILRDGSFKNYDCCLGTRFMHGALLKGYSKIRILGNYAFNTIFSVVLGKKTLDVGSGLNMYRIEYLKSTNFIKYRDDLYFEVEFFMHLVHRGNLFLNYPICWQEADQISNNKLLKCALSLLSMLLGYMTKRDSYFEENFGRRDAIYDYQIVWEQ